MLLLRVLPLKLLPSLAWPSCRSQDVLLGPRAPQHNSTTCRLMAVEVAWSHTTQGLGPSPHTRLHPCQLSLSNGSSAADKTLQAQP